MNTRVVSLTLLAALVGGAAHADVLGPPTRAGMAGAGAALERGLAGARANPANLAWADNPWMSTGLFDASILVGNDAVDLDLYNRTSGARLSGADKRNLLDAVPPDGLTSQIGFEASASGLQFRRTAVFFDVETIRIHDVIFRPDAGVPTCASVLYEDGNVIDPSPYLAVPTDVVGIRDSLMSRNVESDGVYIHPPLRAPSLAELFDTLGIPSGCNFGGGYREWLFLLPPAVPTPTDAFVTHLDVEFVGITATAYDKAGESATATFPDLRIVFTTGEEVATLP